jgi:hypothetical protein
MDVMKVRRKKTGEAAGRTDKSKEYGDHMKKQSPQKRKKPKKERAVRRDKRKFENERTEHKQC